MTREQIEQMQAGPEMDCLIAEQVFGQVWIHNRHYGYLRSEEDADDSVEDGLAAYGPHPEGVVLDGWTERYSTDIAAAWQVASLLNRKGFEVELKELLPYRGREDNLSRCHLTKSEDEEFTSTWSSMADDMPLAICRAALLACLAL